MFSIEQTIIQLSLLSLITSISYSFQPISDSSTNTSFIGDKLNPFSIILRYSFLLFAVPPPDPPSVNEGLIITGKDNFFKTFIPSFILFITNPLGVSKPIFFIDFLNNSLSSAFWITLLEAPIRLTLYFFRIFLFSSSMDRLRAVWPPIVERSASGFSFLIIFSIIDIFKGSIYVLSARSGSVIMVAGFELTKTILNPSSLSALHA